MSTRKLLLADDSVTIQKVVNLTFADEGIEVISVGNGDAAIEKMAEVIPDLVMADVNMPGLSGYQVCERIKQDDRFKQTPVILLVGSFEPFDEEKARQVGADDFLTKPFQSIRQLVSKVTALLDAGERSAAQLYEATANSSFADTLEMDAPEITDSDQANELGDAGMDDEMIQTNQVSSFLDESAKFETKDSYEDPEDYKKTQPLSVYDLKEFSFVAHSPEKENEPPAFAENAGLNESEAPSFVENEVSNEDYSQNFAENSADESESQNFTENTIDENAPELQNYDENLSAESNFTEQRKEDFGSFLDSSDDDLLEIPFDEDEEWETEEGVNETEPVEASETSEIAPQIETGETTAEESFTADEVNSERNFSSEPAPSNNENAQNEISHTSASESYYRGENEIVVGTLLEPENNESAGAEKNEDSNVSAAQFSPELIDAIAEKVIEKLSDQVVREIAWEVVPQHADLIIKKMVEEKLKE